jgi:hypothetical protein
MSKIYEVIEIDDDGYYGIIDDINIEDWFSKEYFRPLSEIRNEKIDKLLR